MTPKALPLPRERGGLLTGKKVEEGSHHSEFAGLPNIATRWNPRVSKRLIPIPGIVATTALLAVAVSVWICFVALVVPDRWEDSYGYILSAQAAADQNSWYAFSFGRIQHPAYTFILYALAEVTGAAAESAKAFSIACYFAVLLLMMRIGHLLGGRRTAATVLVLGSFVMIDFVQHMIAVLSGPMFTCGFLLALVLILRGRPWLGALAVAPLGLIRSEYVLVLIGFVAIRLIAARYRDIAILVAVNVPAGALWMVCVLGASPSAAREVLERYGDRGLLSVIEFALARLSAAVIGRAAIGTVVVFVVIFLGWALAMYIGRPRWNFGSLREFAGRDDIQVNLLMVGLVAMLIGLNYLGLHPLAVRHFGFVLPLVVLSLAHSSTMIDQLAARSRVRLGSVPVFTPVMVCVLGANIYLPTPALKDNFGTAPRMTSHFSSLSHYMDDKIEAGRFLASRLQTGERFLCSLPSVWFYSGYGPERGTNRYPENLLSADAFVAQSIRYIVWSDIYSGENLKSREQLARLRNRRDFLFFKFEFAPERDKGWVARVYSIEPELAERPEVVLGDGWYGAETFGRWTKSRVSTIDIGLAKRADLVVTFDVMSFLEPSRMTILVNDEEHSTIDVAARVRGSANVPTPVSLVLGPREGNTRLTLVGPPVGHVPARSGWWDDSRELRLAFSEFHVNGQKIF